MTVSKRAVLIFACNLGADLARRRLPRIAERLLSGHRAAARMSDADVHLFTTGVNASDNERPPHVHAQRGATFAERLENATACLAALGYDEIVMIGRDCPELCERDIRTAFAELRRHRLVLGPDHRGGCYLIAFRAADRGLLQDVQWRQNTDCAQLVARVEGSFAGDGGIIPPLQVALLAVKQDLDSWADVRLLARSADWAGRIAAYLLTFVGLLAQMRGPFVDLAARAVRVRGQMPPPNLAAA